MCTLADLTLDSIQKLSTILIAACNLFFTLYIFSTNRRKSDFDKKKDRNIQSLKVLVLDHNFKYFYSFFDDVEIHLNEFKVSGLNDEEKSLIVEKVSDDLILLRRKFIDTLLAIDRNLYDKVLDKFDTFETYINDTAFDLGINLSHAPKFDDSVASQVSVLKTDSLQILFNYNG